MQEESDAEEGKRTTRRRPTFVEAIDPLRRRTAFGCFFEHLLSRCDLSGALPALSATR